MRINAEEGLRQDGPKSGGEVGTLPQSSIYGTCVPQYSHDGTLKNHGKGGLIFQQMVPRNCRRKRTGI